MISDTHTGSADKARETMMSSHALNVIRAAADALKWGTITIEVKDSRPVMTKVQIDTKN